MMEWYQICCIASMVLLVMVIIYAIVTHINNTSRYKRYCDILGFECVYNGRGCCNRKVFRNHITEMEERITKMEVRFNDVK